MPSTYTTNNGIELIATGEQSGTWGTTTNTNLSLLDASLDGQVTITLTSAGSSGSPNDLPVTNGAASNGRNRVVIFNDGSDLGATAYVQLTPNDAEKIIYIRNSLSGSRDIIVFQGTYSASNDYVVPNGTTAVVLFDGAGTGAVAANVFNNAAFDALQLGTSDVSVNKILDQDDMSGNDASALATQQSIKAYVDSQVGANNELSEVLANGNTTGGTDISVSSGDDITFADNSKTIFGAGSDLSVYSDGSDGILAATANLTLDVAGDINLDADGADINLKDGGTRFGILYNSSSDFLIEASVQDKDIKFLGNDGGSGITALRLDMSEAGAATFNSTIALGDNKQIFLGDGSDGRISFDGTNTLNITASNGTATTLNLTANNFTIGGASALISGTANTSVVINEASEDVDFRVESNSNTHALFVDAGNDRVGVFNSSPSTALDVTGTANADNMSITSTAPTLVLNRTDRATDNKRIRFAHDSEDFRIQLFNDAENAVTNAIGVNRTGMTLDSIVFFEDTGTTAKFHWSAADERLGLGTTSPNVNLDIESSSEAALDLHSTAGKVFRLRSTTSSEFIIRDSSAAVDRMTIESGGNVIFNESGTGSDFRVESDNQANMLVVDASADKVGIGGSAGDTTLTVRGSNNSAGDLFTAVGAGNVPGIVVQNAGTTDNNSAAVFFKNDAAVVASVAARFTNHTTEETELRFSTTDSSGATREKVFLKGDGTLITKGGAVFNQDSADADFRVESNNNANMLFVDAGNDRVAVGTSSPQSTFVVTDNGGAGVEIIPQTANDRVTALSYDRNADTYQTLDFDGLDIHFNTSGTERFRVETTQVVVNELSNDIDFRVESNAQTHAFFVDAGNNSVHIGDSTDYGAKLNIVTANNSAQLALVSTDEDANQGPLFKLYRNSASPAAGDYAGAIYFDAKDSAGTRTTYAEQLMILNNVTNSSEEATMIWNVAQGGTTGRERMRFSGSEAVFNEGGADLDFRVESDANANMLLVNAGNNSVSIGTSNSEATFTVGGSATFNADSADADFRVESNNNANMFFVDGGSDKVGIGRDPADVSSTLQIAADITTSNDLQLSLRGATNENKKLVLGYDTTSDIASITSFEAGVQHRPLHLQGLEFVWNEDGSDHDFRVESDANSHFLFVDAGVARLGIGTSGPQGSVHLKDITDSGGADVFYVAQNTSASRISGYQVFDESGTVSLKMQYDNGGNNATIINPNNGSLAVYLGGTAAANALDDYEEGTWNPDVAGSTTNGTSSFTFRHGTYTKVGNMVTVVGYYRIASATGTGNLQITGLPFTVESGAGNYAVVTIGETINLSHTSGTTLSGYALPSNAKLAITQIDYTGTGTSTSLVPIDAAHDLLFQCTYRTA